MYWALLQRNEQLANGSLVGFRCLISGSEWSNIRIMLSFPYFLVNRWFMSRVVLKTPHYRPQLCLAYGCLVARKIGAHQISNFSNVPGKLGFKMSYLLMIFVKEETMSACLNPKNCVCQICQQPPFTIFGLSIFVLEALS